jgi:hypothetical protein
MKPEDIPVQYLSLAILVVGIIQIIVTIIIYRKQTPKSCKKPQRVRVQTPNPDGCLYQTYKKVTRTTRDK